MANDSELWLLRCIKVLPVTLTMTVMLAITLIFVGEEQRKIDELIDGFRQDFLTSQREQAKRQLDNIHQHLLFEASQAVGVLKADIRERIYEAHSIASGLYRAFPNREESELQSLISEALREVRFNEGRGYFFIFSMEGISVMHGLLPHIEGTSKIDAKDSKGTLILKQHIDLIRQSANGEAFYQWWYRKPGQGDIEFEKIGFGKRFEPFDWFIGTGEYVSDVEDEIKQDLLEWLTALRYGEDNYVFVMDMKGVTLAHKDPDRIGDPEPDLLEIIRTALNGELSGFVEYQSPYVPKGIFNSNKVSYVQVLPEWGWIIGTGFFTEHVERVLSPQVVKLKQSHSEDLLRVILILSGLMVLLVTLSFWASKLVKRRFDDYQQRIEDDIKQLEISRVQLETSAHIDSLTGIPNRSQLDEQLERCIEQCRIEKSKYAVLFVDLDDFKRINDKYGHHAGDELLKAVSTTFSKLRRDDEILVRFGGDEFVFGFPVIEEEEAMLRAERIQESIAIPILFNGVQLSTNCSIGIAMFPDHGANSSELLSHSDVALYTSKEQKKGQIQLFTKRISEVLEYQFALEEQLSLALAREEISVEYQPKINAASGELIGVEALCRWHSSELGYVPPDEFIEVAEKKGLIIEIGDFVMKQACKDIVLFNRLNHSQISVAINISPLQLLHKDFELKTKNILTSNELANQLVTFEITENVVIEDTHRVKDILTKLSLEGFGVSLDDFGTGYSSLRYVNDLPITEIKIDRQFILDINDDNYLDSLANTIIAIGHSNQLNLVAEGVETKRQAELLNQMGCQVLQGYYFDKPLLFKQLCDKYIQRERA
ncbi:signal transduction protein [Vibrio neptunius]|uniref:bifunctional diguanylate cyclase/phosphodiesterase n=1 Tax=Vibrio neptunius TaxID=170651 RepID=UPI0005F9BA9E|nr:cache domain-containing protein [Vibrio neptunius]KJY87335.1 signal transduction protein [Vibrio neptunius]